MVEWHTSYYNLELNGWNAALRNGNSNIGRVDWREGKKEDEYIYKHYCCGDCTATLLRSNKIGVYIDDNNADPNWKQCWFSGCSYCPQCAPIHMPKNKSGEVTGEYCTRCLPQKFPISVKLKLTLQ
jgi:hypothetical protein